MCCKYVGTTTSTRNEHFLHYAFLFVTFTKKNSVESGGKEVLCFKNGARLWKTCLKSIFFKPTSEQLENMQRIFLFSYARYFNPRAKTRKMHCANVANSQIYARYFNLWAKQMHCANVANSKTVTAKHTNTLWAVKPAVETSPPN